MKKMIMAIDNLRHHPFIVTQLNRKRVAIEVLTLLLSLPIVALIGQVMRHSSLRHHWITFLFGVAVVGSFLLLTQLLTEMFSAGRARLLLFRAYSPVIITSDRMKLTNCFPLSLVTILWFRLAFRLCWGYDGSYRAVHLTDPLLSRLLALSVPEDPTHAVALADDIERTANSLVEYVVARDLRNVLTQIATEE